MALREQDLNGRTVRALREQLGLTQAAFWSAVGVTQSVGCRYEADMPIPRAVRILIVANYISGLKIEAHTADGVKELKALGRIQSSFQRASDVADTVRGTLDEAAHHISEARKSLARL